MGYVKRFATGFAVTMIGAFIQPAAAAPVDISTVTCQEMMDLASSSGDQQAEMGVALWWLLGYAAPAENGTVLDLGSMDGVLGKIETYCTKNPKFGLMTAVEKFGGTEAPALSKKAVDVSTVKCETVMTGADNTLWGAIPWLLGYDASDDGDTAFDIDHIGHVAEEVGAFCAQNPKSGLLTAVKSAVTAAAESADPAADSAEPATEDEATPATMDEGTEG